MLAILSWHFKSGEVWANFAASEPD